MNILAFILFVLMLLALMRLHHHKLHVVLCGFVALSAWFVFQHAGFTHWGEHFMEPHRFHLLFNLAILIPGFACVANAFERSGAAHSIAARVTSVIAVLWIVFWLSTVLDNIAAAMIGGVLVMALPGKPSFATLIGVICASNLGGAGSPIGDTTTVMLYLSKDPLVPLWQIFFAFIGSLPAMLAITCWVQWKNRQKSVVTTSDATVVWSEADKETMGMADDEDALSRSFELEQVSELELEVAGAADDIEALRQGQSHTMQWGLMFHLLGVVGLIIGNIAFDQPGIGLWAGLGLGIVLSQKGLHVGEFVKSIPNTVFLVVLVATAEMLPLDALRPLVASVGNDVTAIGAGLLSAWFDNIPLTALLLQLGNMDWSLVAYCVGYGGSAMWFGSSAGVALGLMFPELYNTKHWWGWSGPFMAVTTTYFIGVAALLLGRVFFPL